MRAPEGVVQELSSPSVMTWDGGHDYKTNVAFNCMATSGILSLTSLDSAKHAVLSATKPHCTTVERSYNTAAGSQSRCLAQDVKAAALHRMSKPPACTDVSVAS